MSVIDELKGLEDRVARRLKELRPLVEEYRELEQVAQRLGVSRDESADTPQRPRRPSRRATTDARTKAVARTNTDSPAHAGARTTLDASAKADAPTEPDAGTQADTGATADAGTSTDARTGTDTRAGAGAPTGTDAPSGADATGTDARARKTPRAGGRREQLLAMVRERPGVTVREIGAELGVDPTSLYRIVHRLERDGVLEKRGRALRAR